jgi:uncharacterized protein involved in exopolysaccharide biosynthesis
MNTPTVQLLDPAVPPERHSRPRKGLLTLAAWLVAFLGTASWAAATDRDDRSRT